MSKRAKLEPMYIFKSSGWVSRERFAVTRGHMRVDAAFRNGDQGLRFVRRRA